MDQFDYRSHLRNGASFSLALDRRAAPRLRRAGLSLLPGHRTRASHPFGSPLRAVAGRPEGSSMAFRRTCRRPRASGCSLALAQSVRETDFIGWYEDQRVAGAVLTEVAEERQHDSIRRTRRPHPPPFRDAFPRRRVEPPGYPREHDPRREGLELSEMALPSARPSARTSQQRPEFSSALRTSRRQAGDAAPCSALAPWPNSRCRPVRDGHRPRTEAR